MVEKEDGWIYVKFKVSPDRHERLKQEKGKEGWWKLFQTIIDEHYNK